MSLTTLEMLGEALDLSKKQLKHVYVVSESNEERRQIEEQYCQKFGGTVDSKEHVGLDLSQPRGLLVFCTSQILVQLDLFSERSYDKNVVYRKSGFDLTWVKSTASSQPKTESVLAPTSSRFQRVLND